MKPSTYFFLASLGIAEAVTPASKPVFNNDQHPWLDTLTTNLKIIPYTLTKWDSGKAPFHCLKTAVKDITNSACGVYDIEVYDVTYSDCPTPWVVCRCTKPSTLSITSLANRLGQVPVGARSSVRHLEAMAVLDQGLQAWSNTNDFTLIGSWADTDPVMLHEVGHNVDRWVAGNGIYDFSDPSGPSRVGGKTWSQIISEDTCFVSAYADDDPEAIPTEQFAEWGLELIYQLNVGAIPVNPACFSKGLAAENTVVGTAWKYNTTAKCTNRIAASETVCTGPVSRAAGKCEGIPDYNTDGLYFSQW